MQLKVEIDFDQLVALAKELPIDQWAKFKQEVENKRTDLFSREDMLAFLRSAPTFSDEQIQMIRNSMRPPAI